jgi:hypothetical protein
LNQRPCAQASSRDIPNLTSHAKLALDRFELSARPLGIWADLNAGGVRLRKKRWMDRIFADRYSQFPRIGRAVGQREMSTAETFHHCVDMLGGVL